MQLTVIIPTYNRMSVLAAIGSCLQQDLPAGTMEVIVVDDGSKDSSYAALLGMAGAFPGLVTVCRNEVNRGPGASRNRAIDLSRGKYLFFLDSDDIIAPRALEKMIDCAQSSGSDVVIGRRANIFTGRAYLAPVFEKDVVGVRLDQTLAFNTLGPCAKLFSRDLVLDHSIRFAEGRRYGEDQPFVARAYLEAGKLSVLSHQNFVLNGGDDISLTAVENNGRNMMATARETLAVIASYNRFPDHTGRFKSRAFREEVLFVARLLVESGFEDLSLLYEMIEVLDEHYDEDLKRALPPQVVDYFERFIGVINQMDQIGD